MTDATTWIAARDTVWYALAILSAACRCTDDIYCLYLAILVVSQTFDPYSRTKFTTDTSSFRFPYLGPSMLAMNLDKVS